jgi:hypothetical protein
MSGPGGGREEEGASAAKWRDPSTSACKMHQTPMARAPLINDDTSCANGVGGGGGGGGVCRGGGRTEPNEPTHTHASHTYSAVWAVVTVSQPPRYPLYGIPACSPVSSPACALTPYSAAPAVAPGRGAVGGVIGTAYHARQEAGMAYYAEGSRRAARTCVPAPPIQYRCHTTSGTGTSTGTDTVGTNLRVREPLRHKPQHLHAFAATAICSALSRHSTGQPVSWTEHELRRCR